MRPDLIQLRESLRPRVSYPEGLPVAARAEEIIRAIRENPVLIVAGETGSGKTTQLPKMLLDAGYGIRGRIACTQPRRVAALSVSRRVAEELGVQWGRQVGAKIRFTDETSDETLIKFVTDGMLLSEVQGDPDLREYDAIVVDEAHERSLNIDFLLGHLNMLRQRRPDLRIIVTSATIDVEAFSKAFGGAPIIEVSGRTFPVEVLYRPLDTLLEDLGEQTYIDAAVVAVEDLVAQNRPGDILVFLPGERDIREAIDQLSGRRLGGAELLPLFGRLTNAEQQRIFAPNQRRKIIVATNIAETSITVPGIRYVVDAGLARISRYSPQTRTQRLPVEPISRSSADQRKGRCGRVAEGICVRLYSEADYEARPRYTEPEIRRANLAAVILRMIAFKLGDVETFPFIDPPQARAINAGYALLQDLGALDEERRLTPLGRQLARLPVDPTVARMLLEAVKEGALKEVLVIAAGLSIQDPRERPSDAREAAEQMHRRFNDPRSDFLALLNIWKAYHDETEKLSQSALRKFCKSHFLSYVRMREWRDIHAQLEQVMQEIDEYRVARADAEYHTIHRSLLSGLLGNIAQRDEGNHYKATHGRTAMLFPGSALFDKESRKAERKKNKGREKPSTVSGTRTPAWIMAAEWMETTRLYARNCAAIESPWILELGSHLTKSTFDAPRWDEKGERVVCTEKIHLYGLEISRRRVGYSRINAKEATEIFIRSGLVENGITTQLPFLDHNRELIETIEERQTRLRRGVLWSLDDRVHDFYARRLPGGIGNVPELRRWLKESHGGNDAVLRLQESDLIDPEHDVELDAFPDAVEVAGERLALNYVYKPGEEEDGATLTVPLAQFDAIQPGMLDWIVPGYIEQRVEALLRALPKDARKQLFPIAEKTAAILDKLVPSPRPLTELLSEILLREHGIRVRPQDWPHDEVPAHLRPRVAVVDEQNNVLVAGRDWQNVREAYAERVRERTQAAKTEVDELRVWREARAKWERPALSNWTFGDLPERIQLTDVAGVPMEAFPGLALDDGAQTLSIRLYHSPEEALAGTRPAYQRLAELQCARDLAWLEKDLRREFQRVGPDAATLGDPARLRDDAFALLRRALFRPANPLPLRKAVFDKTVQDATREMRGLPQRFVDLLVSVFDLRREIVVHKAPYPGMAQELDALIPPDFLRITPYDRLRDFPRYLKAMLRRAEQYRNSPPKHAQKLQRIRPYAEALVRLGHLKKPSREQVRLTEQLHWMLEEFKVSIFAQDLGTSIPTSEKRMDEVIARAG